LNTPLSPSGYQLFVSLIVSFLFEFRSCMLLYSSHSRSIQAYARRVYILPMLLGGVGAVFHSAGVSAQTAPSASETAAYTGLHAAAQRGNVPFIQTRQHSPEALNAPDSYGRTPLHVATFAKQREAIRALAKAGADLNKLESDRYDAVTIAAVADDEETLRVLLQLGASAKLTTSRWEGTALIAVAHLGHDGVVRQLIQAGAPLDHVNNLHWTAAIEAVVLGNGGARHQASLKALIDAGANLKLTDRTGQTPLQLARARGFSEMVSMLEKAEKKR
jgi:uncharacterized protein